MPSYTLLDGVYLLPTPAGAYHAISSPEPDKSQKFLRQLLVQNNTPQLLVTTLQELMHSDDEEKNLELLHLCQKLGWVQGIEQPIQAPQGTLEKMLPALLQSISEKGKVLLADSQGFYLASSGFPHEVAEELSALSAEIATVHARRSGLLGKNLGVNSHAWSVVDAAGNSQVGFWPVYIGNNRFVVVVAGVPHFNQPEFVSLVWALSIRYAKD